ASIDRGTTWTKFATGLPSVAVYDLKIHPRDHELMAATLGRSLWIVDIAPLEQVNAKVIASSAHLFEPKTALQWGEGPTLAASGNGNAQAFFQVPTPPYGAEIHYRLGAGAPAGAVRIFISNAAGDTIATLNGAGGPGLHTVLWNYQGRRPTVAAAVQLSASERRDSILRVARAPGILDSLKQANYDTIAINRARQLITAAGNPAAAGAGGGRGGGGGGRGAGTCERPLTQWDPFCARPGEGAAGAGGRGA